MALTNLYQIDTVFHFDTRQFIAKSLNLDTEINENLIPITEKDILTLNKIFDI